MNDIISVMSTINKKSKDIEDWKYSTEAKLCQFLALFLFLM